MSTQSRVDLLEDVGPVTLTKQWYADGTVIDAGTVTIGITDANGDTVVAAATATTKTGATTTTTYTYALAAQAEPNRLKVTWTRSDTSVPLVDWIEVFGSQLFTEAEARAYQISGAQAPLSAAAYTDAMIANERLRIQDLFESKTGRSWVRRYARVALRGSGCEQIRPGDGRARDATGRKLAGDGYGRDIVRVISGVVNGTAVDLANVVVDGDRIWLTSGTWATPSSANPLNVVIEYEYGIDPPDSEAHENALILAMSSLVPSDVSSFADSFSNQAGNTSFNPEFGFVYPKRVFEWLKRADMRVFV